MRYLAGNSIFFAGEDESGLGFDQIIIHNTQTHTHTYTLMRVHHQLKQIESQNLLETLRIDNIIMDHRITHTE
jgi:hypothetical protein